MRLWGGAQASESGGPGARAWPHCHRPPQDPCGDEATRPNRILGRRRRHAGVRERRRLSPRRSHTQKWHRSTSAGSKTGTTSPSNISAGIIRVERTLWFCLLCGGLRSDRGDAGSRCDPFRPTVPSKQRTDSPLRRLLPWGARPLFSHFCFGCRLPGS